MAVVHWSVCVRVDSRMWVRRGRASVCQGYQACVEGSVLPRLLEGIGALSVSVGQGLGIREMVV